MAAKYKVMPYLENQAMHAICECDDIENAKWVASSLALAEKTAGNPRPYFAVMDVAQQAFVWKYGVPKVVN